MAAVVAVALAMVATVMAAAACAAAAYRVQPVAATAAYVRTAAAAGLSNSKQIFMCVKVTFIK